MGYRQTGWQAGFPTGRGVILAGIVALHGLALLAFSNVGIRQRLAEVAAPVEVVFLEEREAVPLPPPPPPTPRIAAVPPVDLVLPTFDLPAAAPAPTAITVVPPTAQTDSATNSAAADIPVVVDAVDYIRLPRPRYPETAKRARVHGIVMLRVLIDREGRPREVRIHRSSGSGQLDAAARDSVLDALFKPYRENGEARSVQVIIPIEFSLAIRTASRS